MNYYLTDTQPKRKADPHNILANPSLENRIAEGLVGAPWDVFSTPEVAEVIDDNLSPLALNDWFYKGARCQPPREPMHTWKGNKGFYRKDALMGWARSGGSAVRPYQMWQMSAEYLSQTLNLRHPWTLRDTEEDILWLLGRGIISLRAKHRNGDFKPFSDERMAQNPAWGRHLDYPVTLANAD